MSGETVLRLGVLGSGRCSNLEAIIRAIGDQRLPAVLAAVLSYKADARLLELGITCGTRCEAIVPATPHGRLDPVTEGKFVDVLRAENVDLVVLAGFMRIVGPVFLAAYPRRIINIHPSLLPKHRGVNAAAQALAAGDRLTGCTVHYVTPEVDEGPIIDQAVVRVEPADTLDTLAKKIHAAEHALLPAVLARLSESQG